MSISTDTNETRMSNWQFDSCWDLDSLDGKTLLIVASLKFILLKLYNQMDIFATESHFVKLQRVSEKTLCIVLSNARIYIM